MHSITSLYWPSSCNSQNTFMKTSGHTISLFLHLESPHAKCFIKHTPYMYVDTVETLANPWVVMVFPTSYAREVPTTLPGFTGLCNGFLCLCTLCYSHHNTVCILMILPHTCKFHCNLEDTYKSSFHTNDCSIIDQGH